MKNEFALAFNEVLEEKQLPKEVILAAIESAMVSAYRRSVVSSSAQLVESKIDPETGEVKIFAEKEVVEEVQDERTEVTLEDARLVEPEAELGDMVVVDSTPSDFGRVAAQTARQVIQQRIREAERKVQSDYFEKQVGEIVSGVVQAINNQGITIGLDMKAEGIMPSNHKIPGERFRLHDRIRMIVLEVKDNPRGPQIILSRSHRNFLRRLLENEVPEIYHGIVEIRAIAREPGHRAKVAVSATQPGVDPVGACVGLRGVRIQTIVKELHDEKIDIIEWNNDPIVYISKAISPARVSGVFLTEVEKTATVVVQEDQLSLAIGRDGQNARLAAKLTGWRIDIKSLQEAVGDGITKMQSDEELVEAAPVAAENLQKIVDIMAKKGEGRVVTPEEYQSLVKFVERVERRVEERSQAEQAELEAQIAEARALIPEVAFSTPVEFLELAESVNNILAEGQINTAGDLMLTMSIDPEKIRSLSGIGPVTMETIEETIANAVFPEPEPEPEPEAEAETVLEGEAEVVETGAAEGEQPLSEGGEIPAEEAAEAVESETEDESAEEESVDDRPLDEIFSLRPDMLTPPVSIPEEDEVVEDPKKKKKKKKKKHIKLEYDPDLDEVIVTRKHKRDDNEFGEDW
jgi:transcription termination/antitermination protein NusA